MYFYGRKAASLFGDGGIEYSALNNVNFFKLNIAFCVVYQLAIHFYVHRVLLYSEFANVILLSSVPGFVREKNFRSMLRITILTACLFYWWWIFVLGKYSGTWPYESIL